MRRKLMRRWIRVAWYMPVDWPQYRRMSRVDRELLDDTLQDYLKEAFPDDAPQSLTGSPPRRERNLL